MQPAGISATKNLGTSRGWAARDAAVAPASGTKSQTAGRAWARAIREGPFSRKLPIAIQIPATQPAAQIARTSSAIRRGSRSGLGSKLAAAQEQHDLAEGGR